MGEVLSRATDPRQYDFPETGWPYHGIGLDSPVSAVYWEYLSSYSEGWRNRDILDIGAGTGWLIDLALKFGAKSAIGIDPSQKNIEIVKTHFPQIEVVLSTLEEFQTDRTFDVATAIMSLNHIGNIEAAFRKIASLLKISGELQAIVPDYNYFKIPRHGYDIRYEDISEDEYATLVIRPDFGTLADVIRTVSKYKSAGRKAGMNLVEDRQMTPTDQWMERFPRFRQMSNITLWHLLKFGNRGYKKSRLQGEALRS